MKARRVIALGRLAGAVVRFSREWRGHPESPYALYGLLGDPSQPWRLPSAIYKVPYIPLRLYIRAADALLFRAWAWSRVPLARITAAADPGYVDRVLAERTDPAGAMIRERVNADLALRDELGIAPDGGSFTPSPARLTRYVSPRSDGAREADRVA